MIIVSVQRLDVVSIDHVDYNIGVSIESKKDRIISERGEPLEIRVLNSNAIELDYIGEFGHETIMICKGK